MQMWRNTLQPCAKKAVPLQFFVIFFDILTSIFKEGELDKESNMQILHNTLSKYKPTAIYNLDVIFSVGYRVKSQRGVQFRQWANRVLKQYLIKGYAINKRLHHEQISELRQLVQVVGRTLQHREQGKIFLQHADSIKIPTSACLICHFSIQILQPSAQKHQNAEYSALL